MTILIAGIGYIGEPLADQFDRSGRRVIGLTRSTRSAAALAAGKPYHVRACDISDPKSLAALKASVAAPDTIVHCASSGGGGAESYREVYLLGARHLLETFPGARLLFTSSTSVYGQSDGSAVSEESPTEPGRETGRILLETESLVISGGGTVARLAGIYGPGRSHLLKRFLTGDARIEEDGAGVLNQAHRSDIVSALTLLIASGESAGEIYNICDDAPLTQLECYTYLAEHFGAPLPPGASRDLDRKRGWTSKRVSNAKLRALGWSPEYPSFRDAVEKDPAFVSSIRPPE